jgi:thymidylate kinase
MAPKMTSTFTVALVGADGAGKTTIARRLERDHPLPIRYLYMGVNPAASDRLLPSTRLGGRLRSPGDRRRGGRVRRSVRAWLRVGNLVAEEWYRQVRVWGHLRRGRVVVFDRHFLADYRAHDISGHSSLPLSRRLHGFLLSRVYPRPDLVICLDAPPEVLHARKPEDTIDRLACRRQEYLDQAAAEDAVVLIDASRPLEDVTAEVFDVVSDFAGATSLRRTA